MVITAVPGPASRGLARQRKTAPPSDLCAACARARESNSLRRGRVFRQQWNIRTLPKARLFSRSRNPVARRTAGEPAYFCFT